MIEYAVAIVGLVVLVHNSAIPLPNWRPWNCGLCTATWVAIIYGGLGVWSGEMNVDNAIVVVGETALIAGLVASLTPLFRSATGERGSAPQPQPEDDWAGYSPTEALRRPHELPTEVMDRHPLQPKSGGSAPGPT